MNEHWIEAPNHGRLLIESGDPARILMGFHGYGESAEVHLAQLAQLDVLGAPAGWTRVAVQAPHPFYNRQQEVVANWMTRQGRELAIADNVAYVARCAREVHAVCASPVEATWVLAGFSQGVAMAYRAAAASFPPDGPGVAGLLALGGDVPPELDAAALARIPRVLLGRGDKETWYQEAKFHEDIARLRAAGVDVRPLAYAGGHEWTEEFREAARDFLAELAEGPRPGPLRHPERQ